jgi:hypothetical protein
MRIIYDTTRKVNHTDNKLETTYKHIFISTIFTMKNNLFKKFLALFLTGTMLTGVGCKDYDDDIDDLKGQIEDLKGKIELKADASALQTIADKLQNVDFTAFVTNAQLDTKLAGYVESSKLAEEVKKFGYKTEADILKLIGDNTLDQAAINKLIEAQFTLANIWTKEVQKEVQALIDTAIGKIDTSVSDADLTKIKQAIIDAINNDKEVDGIREAISDMVGSGFKQYMADYIKQNTDIWAGQVGAAAIDAIDAANSALKDKIVGLINETAKGPDYGTTGNAAYLKDNDLTTVFTEYNAKITAIWNAIDDLAGRIQSIVFVPTETNAEIDVNFGGSYIEAAEEADNILLASSPKVKIAFRVAPAALAATLAKQITDGKVAASFIPEEVIKTPTRAAEEAVVPVTYENVIAKDGKLVFTAVANEALYKKLAKEGKTYAVALCLKQEAVPNEDGKEGYKSYGFEVVSPYISTSSASDPVNEHFVLATSVKEGETEKLVAYKDAAVYPLVWNSTETKEPLKDHVFAYQDGKELISLKTAAEKYLWDADVFGTLKPAYEHTSAKYFTKNGSEIALDKQTQLTINPANPTDEDNVKTMVSVKNNASKQSVGNVGDRFEMTDKVFITNGSKSILLFSDVKSQVKVTGDMAAELKDINVSVDWKYASYVSTDNTYSSFIVTVPADKAMPWETFKKLPNSISTTVAELPKDTGLILKAGEKTPTIKIEPIEMVSAESAQQFRVIVTNWLNGDGEATFTADANVGGTETFVSISGKATFKGLPAMSYTLATVDEKGNKTSVAYANGKYIVTLNSKLNELIYNANKAYFANAGEVTAFLKEFTDAAGIAQAASQNGVKPIVLEATAGITDGKIFKINFDGAKVNWQTQAEYSYNVPSGEGKGSIFNANKAFELKVNGVYTLKSTGYQLNANPNYLENGVMLVSGQVKDNKFVLNEINLTNAFTKSEEAKDATIKYALKTQDDGFSGVPTISKDEKYIMTWGNCRLNSVVVTATLEDKDKKVLDSQDFTVQLNAPILFADWKFFNGSKITVPVAGQKPATFNVIDKILAMDKDGNTPAIDPETSAWENAPVAIDVLKNALYEGDDETGYSLSGIATADTGYGIEVKYGELKWTGAPIAGVTFSTANGVITVPAGNEVLVGTPTATIEVTYTYKYDWTAIVKDNKVTGYEPTEFKKTITVAFTK